MWQASYYHNGPNPECFAGGTGLQWQSAKDTGLWVMCTKMTQESLVVTDGLMKARGSANRLFVPKQWREEAEGGYYMAGCLHGEGAESERTQA